MMTKRSLARASLLAMLLTLLAGTACTSNPRVKDPESHEWKHDEPELSGDWDEAEARWRRDIANERWSDSGTMLGRTAPDGPVAFAPEATSPAPPSEPDAVGDVRHPLEDPAADEGFWNKAGKASFAAFTVAFTLGMMVAPYLLL